MRDNWVTNNKMKEIFDKILPSSDNDNLKLSIYGLKKLFLPEFKMVRDCIIITEKDKNVLEATFDNAIKTYTDRTGYEASNTETRINYYFENKLSTLTGVKIALIVIECWAIKLKFMEPDSKFCFILYCDAEDVEIRFHKVRKSEKTWLSEDLEGYVDGAVGYIII